VLHETKFVNYVYFGKSNSTHHITKLLTSVIYITIFITEKQTYCMCHARFTVHFMFSSAQQQQHQTPGNASSCHSFLQFSFSCIKMQFTLYLHFYIASRRQYWDKMEISIMHNSNINVIH
jgi:hypothetical protein